MISFPITPSRLTPEQKAAYRRLISEVLLTIRILSASSERPRWNPLVWWRQHRRSQLVVVLADWLHNLAIYSSCDFEGFNEDWFWMETESFQRRWQQIRPRGDTSPYESAALAECRTLRGSGERDGRA